jgi:signal transduction histidine kinase
VSDARTAGLRRFRVALTRAASLEELANAALLALRGVFADLRAELLTFDGDGTPQLAAAAGLSERGRALIARHAPRERPWVGSARTADGADAPQAAAEKVTAQEKPAPADVMGADRVWLSDIERDAAWLPARAALQSEGIRAIAFVPAGDGERPIALLALCLDDAAALPSLDLSFAETVAFELALVIEHRRQLVRSQEAVADSPLAPSNRDRDRTRLLAGLSNALASSLDPDTTLQKLALFVVPALADYAITYACEGPRIRRLGWAHRNPRSASLLEGLLGSGEPTRDDRHGPGAVIRTGAPILARYVTNEMIVRSSQNERHSAAVLALAPRSSMVVPLESRGRIIGAISFATTEESGRHYDDHDLRFACDLAQRVALLVDNARLYREAREAVRMRDDILAVVSHDLRNPLNTISVASSLLELEPKPDVAHKAKRSIARAAKQMERLIQDLLDVSRAESGNLPLSLAPLEVASLIEEAYALAQPQAEDKSVKLERRVAANLGTIEGDRDRLLQVLGNLIGNAIKFVPAGGTVTIGAQDLYGQIRLWISDNGPGISAEHIPRVFDRFWQANRQGRRGAGLGLTIAKSIIDAHGGQIGVHSQEGEGSTFFCWLPCSPGAGGTPSEATTPRSEPARESAVPTPPHA